MNKTTVELEFLLAYSSNLKLKLPYFAPTHDYHNKPTCWLC